MKRWMVLLALVCSSFGCAADGVDMQDDHTGHELASAEQGLSLSPGQIVTVDAGALSPDLGTGDVSALGKNACTPDRQAQCDACVDACDYLCDRPNGGGPAGGCIGLFCPTKCDACVLGCYKACGKCTPSQF